ncbi:inositol polyphosphate 5-phosphatase K-like [Arapaima gigas]
MSATRTANPDTGAGMEARTRTSASNTSTVGPRQKMGCRLHVVTWNVATAEPPGDVSSLLQLNSQVSTDLFVIGLQEVNARPLRYISDLAFDDSWSLLFMATLGSLGYVKVSSIRMQGLLLLVFARQAHLPFIRDIQTTYTRTGFFGYWGNKGAVSVRFSFYGHMFCFLNCHLAAHMNYAAQRVDEFEYILDTQDFDMHNTPHVLDHKVVFWFGDLNFRIEDHGLHFLRSAISSSRFNLLWDKDQLLMMRKKEPFLQEFEEGPLCFKPTYKFDRFSDTYDTSGKKRKPAWTDRILWRVKPRLTPPEEEEGFEEEEEEEEPLKDGEELPVKVVLDTYSCCPDYGISDHKPVVGTFCLELKKKCETPLVRVEASGEWSAAEDGLVTYSVLEPFPSSTWDWIGLYKTDFMSALNYITYTWVKDDEASGSKEPIQVYISKGNMPALDTECVLCYYSSNTQSIVGISRPFQVLGSVGSAEDSLVPHALKRMERK